MRSKQYFTSIKNNPHEISTDPRFLLRQDRGRYEHPGTLRRFRRRTPGAGGVFSALMQKRKPRGTCDAAGLLLRRRLPTLPLAQYHRRDEA